LAVSISRPSFPLLKVRSNRNDVISYFIFVGEFEDKDFYYEDCEEINSAILEEAKTFVTFMQTMIEEVVGKEDEMMGILTGKINLNQLGRSKSSIFDEDDEEEE
jgi:hypothetical protein